ncbi:MAG: alpha/beta fold hydrolase [Acidobacteriota bacterium]|nr:alpha/beta fold hydrolase [Acidobacteriota bacterium]
MKEPSISGMRVEGERLSPDGKYVVYLWNAEGKSPRDLYLVSTSGGEAKKILSPKDLITKKDEKEKDDPLEYGVVLNDDFVKSQRNGLGNLRWSPDSSKILFTQNGDIYVLKIGEAKPKRITKTESFEFSAEFLDNDRILFQQNGNLFSIDTKGGTLTQISKEANSAKNISVFGDTHSKNGEMIAYITSDGSNQKPLFVPNYLPLYTSAPTIRRGWTKPTVYVAMTDGSFEKSIEVELPKQEEEAYIAGMEWLADNKTLLIDRVDKTHKRRQIFVIEFDKDNKATAYKIYEETDEKWIGSPARILEANPNNPKQFIFSTENGSKFNHLWLIEYYGPSPGEDGEKVKSAMSEGTKLTDGNWEVDWAKWIKPSNKKENSGIVYSSTKDNTAERKVSIRKNIGFSDQIKDLPLENGMKDDFQLENNKLIFSGSKWNSPSELHSINLCFDCEKIEKVEKLTNTTPEAFLKRKWNEPKFVEINSRDNKKIPAKIYFPANFDKSKKSPMVIFVHGAGYLQNVINGWNNYYREFMFNQLLTQKGYVVLDIDYRGSAGYGRDWRTDVYDFLGGKDYEDHVDSIDFMVKEYNVDVNRIGVYGGSYGGFMAAMLVMRLPDKIAAAAALRPVMDWKNYYAANPFYTSQRLGDPKKNAEAYKRSSPISYAKDLRKHLLILHGLLDDNVHAQDSIQLIEKLIRLDKTEYFDIMVYPTERHSFERPSSWEDEYERILALFEKELK